MAGEKQEAPWPVPKFHFKVTLGNIGEITFQEVSGLETDVNIIDYRSANSRQLSAVRMPDVNKHSNITLKKGIFRNDTVLFDWLTGIKMNTIKRLNVTIQLLDEEHNVLFTWNLKNAFPMKVAGTDFNAQNSEVAIEELVLAHEGIIIETA